VLGIRRTRSGQIYSAYPIESPKAKDMPRSVDLSSNTQGVQTASDAIAAPVPSTGSGAQNIRACLKGLNYDGAKDIAKIDQYLKVLSVRLEQAEVDEGKFFRFIDHTLSGDALTWFLGLESRPISFKTFRDALLERFVAPGVVDELDLHWDDSVQRGDQGIDDYLAEINLKISVAGSTVSDEAKLRCLLKGVRHEYLVDMGPNDKASLQAFIKFCRKKEYSHAFLKGRKSSVAGRVGPVGKVHVMYDEPESGAAGAMPGNPHALGYQGRRPRVMRCWNCSGEGHLARLCPFKKPGVRGCYFPNRSDSDRESEQANHGSCAMTGACNQNRCYMHQCDSKGPQSDSSTGNLN
jgi:hypothetical protein